MMSLNNSPDKNSAIQYSIPLMLTSRASVIEAIAKMRETGSDYVLIATDGNINNEESQLIGILTQTDILRILSQRSLTEDLLIQDEMSYPVITIQETELHDVTIATNLFQEYKISYLPVLNGNQIVGVLTQDGLINLLLQNTLELEENNQNLLQQNLQSLEIQKLQELNQSLELKIKERTQELWEINKLQRAILDSSDYAIITCDLNSTILSFNSGAEAMLGYSMSEVVGYCVPLIFHDPLEIADRIAKLSAERGVDTVSLFEVFMRSDKGITFTQEWTYIRKDGSKFPVELTISTLRDDSEQDIGFLGIAKDITERKRIELALLESNNRFRTVFDSNIVGIMFTDFNGHVTEANDYFLEMLGYSREDLEANRINWLNITPSEYIQQDLDVVEYIQTNGAIKPVEKSYYHKDGHLVHILISAAKLSEQADLCVCVIIDISNLKKAELKIIEQDSQFQELSTASPSIIYTLVQDVNGLVRFKYLNPIFEEITEISIVEAYRDARIVFNQIHPDDKQGYQNALANSCQNMLPFCYEWRIVTYSGKTKWLKASSRPTRRENGAIVWHGVIQDISIVKNTEASLKQKLAAVESAIDGIAILQENKYIYLNRSHLAMFGYEDPEELLGSSWDKLYSPEVIAEIEKEVLPILERDHSWKGELIALHKNGSTFYQGISLTFTDDDLLICVCRDISDSKQAEEKLQQTNQELQKATKLKDEFLANMSHELRTPLNAILGITEGLSEEVFGSLQEKQKNMLKIVEQSGNHLLELINDILDLAKIEAGEITLDLEVSNVKNICQSSLTFIRQMAMQKNLQLDLKGNIPELETLLDERRIRQVLINLLSNAIKFTPSGGKITLQYSLERKPIPNDHSYQDWVCLTVTDTGIGITSDDLKKIFQPFIQVDSSLNRQYNGTGLGLALVKKIVELHGGYVSVTSEVNVGSQFAITLPYSDNISQQPPKPANISPHPSEVIGSDCDLPLVLLAEDNEANISTITCYLEAKGFRLKIARSGQQAINLVQIQPPDLILMDIQMPELDGLEAIKRIRNIGFTKPIIAITALAMKDDRQKCLDAGADEYISKPIKLKLLSTIIQRTYFKNCSYRESGET